MNELAIVRLGLLLVRPGLLVVTAPAFGSTFAPPPVKIALTVLLAIVLAPIVSLPETLTTGTLTILVLREVVIGLAIAFSLRILIAGTELAGYLAGFQVGFSYASLVDPQSGARNSVMSSFYGLMALFVFIATDGHHQMLRALAASYEELPVGAWHQSGNLALLVARVMGMVFTIGVQLAAPVVLVLLIVEVVLGLMARTMPSLNLMISAAPVRLLVGLTAIAATLQILPTVVRSTLVPALEIAARLAAAFR